MWCTDFDSPESLRPVNYEVFVAVPGRIWSHYCIRSALAQNFHYGRASYALCKRGKYSWVYPAHMSPALNRISMLERFECSNASKIHNRIMFYFYPGLPHYFVNIFSMSISYVADLMMILWSCGMKHVVQHGAIINTPHIHVVGGQILLKLTFSVTPLLTSWISP